MTLESLLERVRSATGADRYDNRELDYALEELKEAPERDALFLSHRGRQGSESHQTEFTMGNSKPISAQVNIDVYNSAFET